MKNENKKASSMGILLVEDQDNNIHNNFLEVNRLDFTLESLKYVDSYLEKVRKKKLNEDYLKKILLRCGTYLGEVIRKLGDKKFVWISYEEAKSINSTINEFPKDITTHLIIMNKKTKRLWFPIAKVHKFINSGKADNLSAFARVCLEFKEKE